MPIVLPTALISAKNLAQDSESFLFLLTIEFENETLRVVKNEEAVTYQGNEYQPFFFDFDSLSDQGKNEVPAVRLSVSNVNRAMQAALEEYEGGVGAQVNLKLVYTGEPSENAVLDLDYQVKHVSSDAQLVNFILGVADTWQKPFPRNRMMSTFCRFKFRDLDCQAAPTHDYMDFVVTSSGINQGETITGVSSGASGVISTYESYGDGVTFGAILTGVATDFLVGEVISGSGGGLGYVQSYNTCPKSYEACKGRFNSSRFGGFPGLGLPANSTVV